MTKKPAISSKKSPKKFSKNLFKGYIQVYTGSGKGKTTAALGLALRAAGHGLKTYMGQFLKGQDYGELYSVKRLSSLITIEQFGRKGFVHVTKDPDEEDIQKAKEGLKKCLDAMLSRKYTLIILDEINVAVDFNLIEEQEVHKFLNQKPEHIEVILTGRYAPQSLIARADLVTEMTNIKHYYEIGHHGVCHALFPEEGYVRPGTVVVSADSHTCTHGALGAFATGIGSTDLAAVIYSGELWFKVPESIEVVLNGRLSEGVYSKDIILEIIRRIGVDGAL